MTDCDCGNELKRRILVTGSRHHADRELIGAVLLYQACFLSDDPASDVVLIHGNCPGDKDGNPGADKIADEIWLGQGWPTPERHPAAWNRYGKAAGPIRNQEMVDAGADVCLAFPLPGSHGTYDCMERAQTAGIPVLEVQRDAAGNILERRI